MVTELFCSIDDFCQDFMPKWNQSLIKQGLKHRNRSGQLSDSEIMTIIVLFHSSNYCSGQVFSYILIDSFMQFQLQRDLNIDCNCVPADSCNIGCKKQYQCQLADNCRNLH